MNRIDETALLKKYREGTITEEELHWLESWYADWNAVDRVVLSEEALDAAELKMRAVVMERIAPKRISLWPRIEVAAAAAIILMIAGVWFFNYRSAVILNSVQDPALAVNDIAPGKQGATLTLANGQVIALSDQKTGVVVGADIKYNDNSPISSLSQGDISPPRGEKKVDHLSPSGRDGVAREGSWVVATTAKGQTYQVTLPDGSKVWLNAASSIKFPTSFKGMAKRQVTLTGEAYFEIAKMTHLSNISTISARRASLPGGERVVRVPFIVQTDKQEVEVLGTHFNINAYSDEGAVRTTLLEGSVRVAFLSPSGGDGAAREGSKNSNILLSNNPLSPQGGSLPKGERNSIILKPNQQAILLSPSGGDGKARGANTIKVIPVNADAAVAWKNGDFSFDDEALGSIMRKISRWYSVEVVYEGIDPNKTFGGSISRFENVSKVLENLELTGGVHFQIEGKRIYVRK